MRQIIQSQDCLVIGIDVGSTTVKVTAVNPESRQILWSDYQRHHTKQAEKVLEMLTAVADEFPGIHQENVRVFATGSGSGPIAPHIGAKFIQEVNAVTMAVEHLHADVGSVIELGGQDAKIIIFKENEETGQKQILTSMNDKCASGTGAMIDKCMIKVGIPADHAGELHFDDSKLHHVAAKCGVFAETDIVNLVKSGVPSTEIICSLADAIVMQNLSVLTRGNTLRHSVLLLGGPNTYLTVLQECWRKRIPQTWQERGYDYPKDKSFEELIFVPDHSQYYAAYGAVLYGLHESKDVGLYLGLQGLKEFIIGGRKAKLSEKAGPPLVVNEDELVQFRRNYTIPSYKPTCFTPGQKLRAVIGLDGGSTSSKAVLMDDRGEILLKEYQLSKGNPIEDTKEILSRMRDKLQDANVEIIGFGATGYAADVLEKTLKADVNIVETVAHMMSAVQQFGNIDVICDIGGQDIKVLFLKNRDIRNFKLSNQCSAGNGMLLQAMADQFGIPVQEYADTAFSAELSPNFSYGCAVFLDADRVNFQKEGYSKEELLAGIAHVLPKNVWQYVVQIPRMAEFGRKFVLQGGTQYNLAAVKAQVDYIKQRVPDAEVYVHPHSGEAGAIGTALETLRVVNRRGYSTFLGLDAAIDLRYISRNDESTRCQFCPNHCSRTFVDSETPDGQTVRYISGFSCEKGTVDDKALVVKITKQRQQLKKNYPNLVEYEARRMFQHFYDVEPFPKREQLMNDVRLKNGWLGLGSRRNQRQFEHSSAEARKRRSRIRIGIPRVLNMWSTAPFWRTYFETLGIDERNIVFSDHTSEEMWQEGGKYGSIDPCYPSKVAQAHVHNLLFKCHEKELLDYIFFPCITHIPTYLNNVSDSTSCPIVAGAPNVIKAAFTKEVDFFKARGIVYLDPAVTFTESNLMKQQLYEAFVEQLQITEDESDFAIEQGWKALNLFDKEMQEKGRVILEQVEQENRLAILMIGRPYHSDPGLNHGVLEEFQVLGYPILSIRSIPKDEAWLLRFFSEDLKSGRVKHVHEIGDVWPENFSSNSAQKVWAAKFAARHPNVAVLDLSSFKCGHDAPTYGLIDSIISAVGTPYSTLHDIDANKPSGSIKIRVKTYAHSLGLHEERLQDLARKKVELQQRLEEKCAELLGSKQSEQAGAV
ncbi:BadF/BadG/BcrA/BcrD ATPase family protein [Paenibacillus wynnii]|uniref:BadF/BadG/BcrA/BcrD ATPase family protein n=1 Tax=Paenibacillus wynnii TaxID=268407 RepID=UPI0027937CBF|nr:BadF/BadG/BcrA/BcrD ATPase family protein [Paenibacillus wynnii]MDQ0194827.1 putative CoA-substrate-specific enzyme activase [Paenibacillus wynnii]